MKYFIFLLLMMLIAVAAITQNIIKPDSYADSCAWKTEQGKYIPDIVVYFDTTSGYICGNSSLKMKTKAQKYFLSGSDSIIQVAFLFGKKEEAGNPGYIRAKIYAADGVNGSPGILLGTSSPLSTAMVKASLVNIDSISKLTVVDFPQPVAVADSFFVALDLTQLLNGDSIGLFSTKDDCFSGMQLAWEEDSNGVWHPFNDGTGATYRLDIDMAVFPVRDFHVGISTKSLKKESMVAYPKPASSEVYFQLNNNTNNTGEKRDIYIYDISGKNIKIFMNAISQSGKIKVEVNDFSPGIYFYSINTGDDFFTGKFLIE